MKFAMSNIAWPLDSEPQIATIMKANGLDGVEVAPTKMWPSPLEATDEQIGQYKAFWNDNGIEIVAAQAILYGKPELTIFDNQDTRAQTVEYLKGISKLCGGLGTKAMVFGSPKNRIVPEGMDCGQAWDIAVDFFRAIATDAANHGTAMVIEANPDIYGGNFITASADAIKLVELVDHPGLKLHLDAACMTMAGDDTDEVIKRGAKYLQHFHISEPYLENIFSSGKINHKSIANSLKKTDYDQWRSIEMKQPQDFTIEKIQEIIKAVVETYM